MLLPALATGCSAPAHDDTLVTQSVPAPTAAEQNAVWKAAQNVLRAHQFRLDRVDRRAGVITTDPQTSQHAFELWRKDVATRYDFLEATLRTVRRSVRVTIAPRDGTDEITVEVHKEFYSTPERQFNSSIATMRMFGNELPRADTGERITDADSKWIDAGRDPAMERYLLDQIVARAHDAT
ncbi:MAG TPA: hypothetical protein P5572_00560 [Phycisphaerae bacterium]|nr:hypothetical protein [Phycisphaerae bacterium]